MNKTPLLDTECYKHHFELFIEQASLVVVTCLLYIYFFKIFIFKEKKQLYFHVCESTLLKESAQLTDSSLL